MDPHTTVVVETQDPHAPPGESTIIVQNPAPAYAPPHHPYNYPQYPPGPAVVIDQGYPHGGGYGGGATVIVQNPSHHYDIMEKDRDTDGYVIDDEYYYYDKGYYKDYDYISKDDYWKYFKTKDGEKFKYSRR